MKLDLRELAAKVKASRGQSQDDLYRYGVPNRPIGYATVPSGWVSVEPTSPLAPDHTRHGIVVYDHPLSDKDIYGFELIPIVSEDDLIELILEHIDKYRAEYLELWHGDEYDKKQAVEAVGHAWERTRVIALGATREKLAERVYAELAERQRRS